MLNKDEVRTMCKCMIEVRSQTNNVKSKVNEEDLEKMVSALWAKHDPQGNETLTQEEFLVWTVDNPYPQDFSRMVKNCFGHHFCSEIMYLPLFQIFQLCHIVLGLKPLTRKEEGQIVRGWLDRENGKATNNMAVGSVWHLISMEWWNSWNNYVNHQETAGSARTELVSGKRGGRKPPSLDSTLASDSDKSVVGTSYHQLNSENQYGSLGRSSHGAPNSLDTLSSSSRGHTPSASPYSSRKNSSSSSVNSSHSSATPFPRPGVIDNSNLVQSHSYRVSTLTSEGGKLKSSPKLARGKDFELIPQRLWKALVNWYGGSPALPRHVIRTKDGHVELELSPLSLKLMKHQTVTRPSSAATSSAVSSGFVGGFGAAAGASAGLALPSSSSSSAYSSSPNNTVTRRYHAYQCAFSRRTRVSQVTDFLSQKLHVKPEDMRLWRFRSEQDMQLLEDESSDLEECGFGDDDSMLMEVRSRDGTWPEEITSLYKSTSSGDRRSSVLGAGTYSVKGITGLNNLGNTCYMNSSVQCVANTKILAEYFNKNCHLYELNRSNPLGMKGHIAKRFGDLVRDMWSSDMRTIAPIKLRWTIGKYRPQFAGFQQHDAQELLAFLLDGLHEDLNRVTEHPYVELKDSDNRPDSEVAKEAWDNHFLRNKYDDFFC